MSKNSVVVVKVMRTTAFGIPLIFLDGVGKLVVWVAQQCTSLLSCTSPLQVFEPK